MLNLANKIRNYKKDFSFILNSKETIIHWMKLKKIKVDGSIIRFLTVRYKKLDIKNEFFKKEKNKWKEKQEISKKKFKFIKQA